jgi:hypothetical protein
MNKGTHGLQALLLVALLAAFLAAAPIGHAQTGGGYNLTWNTIAGGGSTFSTGGGYTLGGTAGQPGAGTLTGGGYTLSGGFWAGIPAYATYLPILLKS